MTKTASAVPRSGGTAREAPADPLRLPDADQRSLLFRLAPKSWAPFLQLARIDRPIGWWLLVLPCWQSSALASVHQGVLPHGRDLLLFLIGSIAMRGAGSTYNDIVDRGIDAKVERTRGRPLPSGRVGAPAAVVFLAVQCLIGLAVLLSFNRFAILLGLSSLGFVGIYPFMKRITSWPQAVLGAAFAWGGLMGWAAALGSLEPAPVLLYAGAIFWTIGYDTIYAMMDVKDDAIVGIGSTARFFGRRVRAGVACLYAVSIACVAAAIFAAGAGGLALAGLAGFAAHLAWQVAHLPAPAESLDEDATPALRLFRSNRDAGLILCAGLCGEAVRLALG
ncbi:4-hydroxybenzoate octaprenyltransferase [Methylocella tundrae]|uniref:4-hydroxybenzoate octaprenyltransferase n=1 Tax=Methylocella tundrae TaxID=227605 RepID=A0A8B6M004_METTU|nr:4-hydroxybenzoate octaprenyltransferase [Methylocella tundrae]